MRSLLVLAVLATACASAGPSGTTLVFSGSAVGAEGRVLRRQLDRFMERNPGVRVVLQPTPDSADQRHQLYVQWLNAQAATPDVLQLDVIWTAEFAAAGWVLPLDRFRPDAARFFPQTLAANRWRDHLYALPWFVDVGMLYWRTDLLARAPRTWAELVRVAGRRPRPGGVRHGFVWTGARYEGLVTMFLEVLGAHGGRILDADGRVAVDRPDAARALTALRDLVGTASPRAVLGWQEEPTRFDFQNGHALLMRNWPYAAALLQDPKRSRVAGRFGVAPLPATPAGTPTAALGGAQLAINARSRHPEATWKLLAFLTAPAQMLERARVAGQLPSRPALYDDPALARALPVPPRSLRRVVEHARPRPAVPVYTELSQALQIGLHRALSGQATPRAALRAAARRMRRVLARLRPAAPGSEAPRWPLYLVAGLALAGLAGAALRWGRRGRARPGSAEAREARTAWAFVLPALVVIALIALYPLLSTFWESLHQHDLRLPWQGRPFVGLANYGELFGSPRFWSALGHTAAFTALSVTLELGLGLILALSLHRAYRGRGAVRAAVLLPWALPTVVAALIWRFLFEPTGWLVDPTLAWGPILLADVWKMTPFVALLLLAGLQNIDESLYEAARLDGAGRWQQLVHVTLPLLRPAILVAVLFRTLDAFRVFDLIYALTGGGPGTATEPVALYTFGSLLQNLRFGYGSALSVVIFGVVFVLAVLYVRTLGAGLTEARR